MPLFDHFDFLAPIYEAIIRPANPQEVADRFMLPVSGMLLDAGGGTGRIAGAIQGLVSQVIVADESVPMLRQAMLKNGLQTLCCEVEELPIPSNTFERIIMVDAFHHLRDQERSLSELWRVLAPGGKIIIEEPDIRYLSIKVIALVEKIAFMRSHFIAPLEIGQILHEKHSAIIKVIHDGTTARVVAEKVV
jgi:ubiquinone/menaquinone biosynthesis C-methylase UbiE